MKRVIIADSSLELNEMLSSVVDVKFVPFSITLEGEEFIDDESADVAYFIDKMSKSPEPIKTACPSTGTYLAAMQESSADEIFVITLSAELSGSYNAAVLAKSMYLEEHPEAKVHVFNSKSAVVGESMVAWYIYKNMESDFDTLVETVEAEINNTSTIFVLESLDNLAKNGRLSKMSAMLGTLLSIKPICASDGNGNIIVLEKQRGMKKALIRVSEIAAEKGRRVAFISHTNALDNAKFLQSKMLENGEYDAVEIFETKVLSSGYSSDGGIVLAL